MGFELTDLLGGDGPTEGISNTKFQGLSKLSFTIGNAHLFNTY